MWPLVVNINRKFSMIENSKKYLFKITKRSMKAFNTIKANNKVISLFSSNKILLPPAIFLSTILICICSFKNGK